MDILTELLVNRPKQKFESAESMRKYYNSKWPYRLPNHADYRLKFLNKNLSRAAGRTYNWKIEIDMFDLFHIGEKQNWLCAGTETALEFTRGGTEWKGTWCNPNSCTIDRIDPSKGYIEGNCQLTTWKYNRFKSDWTKEELDFFFLKHKMVSKALDI